MPEADYIAMISALDRMGLLTLWGQIEQGDAAGWEPGKAFEYLVLRALQLDGAEVRWPYSVYLGNEVVEQIDGVVYANGLSCLVESKHWARKVNVEVIAKLRNQLARRPVGAIGAVFSYEGFTQPARTLTQYLAPQTVLLWEGEEIKYALEHGEMVTGLRLKYKHAVEQGLTDYNLLEAIS